MRAGRLPCLEWAVASATCPGESACGDLALVQGLPSGALVVVLDGVGHGAAAASAARRALEAITADAGRSVIALVRRCHADLAGTRGAVMGLARLDVADETMSWLAVGNVDGLLIRAPGPAPRQREGVVMRGGTVGHQLPPLRAAITSIARGDLLVFATDGIRPGFHRLLDHAVSPGELAQRVLADYGRETDDALVLVARYLGAESCEASESSMG